MNYATYHPIDVVNGPGTRCTLFVSGCELACKGCYNRSIQRLDSGFLFTRDIEDQIINDLNDIRIKRRGLSLLGGDPLHPANVESVLAFVKRVREEAPTKDIWCWTGYTLSQLSDAQREVVNRVDVLVDGPFVQELADPSLKWRGSSNQVIHSSHFK
jgi:anaerobic ribonucleoside-triphosphate reductase activating protein